MKKLLILVFLLFFLVAGYRVYLSFSKSVWDGKNRINLVFCQPQIFIFSLNDPEQEAVVLFLPSQTFIEVIHGYGQYRAEAVYQLGEIENHRGGELLADSLQESLGIPVDGFAAISNFQFPISKDKPKDGILAAFRLLLKGGQTNLTKWDLLRLWWEFRKIRQDKVVVVELEKTGVLAKTILPDGSEGFEIEPEKTEKIAQEILKDQKIRQEDLTIAILNGTSHSGLAEKGARIIKNIGGRVVEMGNTENGKCQIRGEKKFKKSYTVKKLMEIFRCQWGGEDLGSHRAEVILILGEDYWKRLTEKW